MQILSNSPPVNLVAQPLGSAIRSTDAAVFSNTGTDATKNKVDESSQIDDVKAIQDAAQRMQDFVSEVRGNIQFSLDTDSGKTVVKVVDSSTKEVIRQFPSQEALQIAKALDSFKGLLVKQQA